MTDLTTIPDVEKTVAVGNVPEAKGKAFDWLIQLSNEKALKELAFNEACKATSEKFGIPVSDLKAGIKARQEDNSKEVIQKLNDKIDIIQEIVEA